IKGDVAFIALLLSPHTAERPPPLSLRVRGWPPSTSNCLLGDDARDRRPDAAASHAPPRLAVPSVLAAGRQRYAAKSGVWAGDDQPGPRYQPVAATTETLLVRCRSTKGRHAP